MKDKFKRWFPPLACTAGVVLAVILLLVPIRVTFGDDPVLRLEAFDQGPGAEAPTADCGPVPAGLTRRTESNDLFFVARDRACRKAAHRRLVVAGASGSLLVVGGLVALAGPAIREKATSRSPETAAPPPTEPAPA